MAETIVIDPITRLEGHGKIVIELNDKGQVGNAFFSVTEFRGFEKFCEGRMIWDMPAITNRICGFCPPPCEPEFPAHVREPIET